MHVLNITEEFKFILRGRDFMHSYKNSSQRKYLIILSLRWQFLQRIIIPL